jgi:hypothetical protein
LITAVQIKELREEIFPYWRGKTLEEQQNFYEAALIVLQATWFLFVLLQIESNASSFSPGRFGQSIWLWFGQGRVKE